MTIRIGPRSTGVPRGMFSGTVTQMNPVKAYGRHSTLKFFVRLKKDDDSEGLCMFWDVHDGRFELGDRIAFSADASPDSADPRKMWYSIRWKHDVVVLQKANIQETDEQFDVGWVTAPRDDRQGWVVLIHIGLAGGENRWVKVPCDLMEAFFFGKSSVQGGVTYYTILGIPRVAGWNDEHKDLVKKAFRGLALQTHPDHNPNDPDAEELFKAINEAYQVLSDASQKQSYDALLEGFERAQKIGARVKRNGLAPSGWPNNGFGKLKASGAWRGNTFVVAAILGWTPNRMEKTFEFPLSELKYRDTNVYWKYDETVNLHGLMDERLTIPASDLPFPTSRDLEKVKSQFVGDMTVKCIWTESGRCVPMQTIGTGGLKTEFQTHRWWRPDRTQPVEVTIDDVTLRSLTVVLDRWNAQRELRRIKREIREQLHAGVPLEKVVAEAEKYGLTEKDVLSTVWRKAYNPEFFGRLKNVAERVVLAEGQFLFIVQDGPATFVVAERPEAGAATYVFGWRPDVYSSLDGYVSLIAEAFADKDTHLIRDIRRGEIGQRLGYQEYVIHSHDETGVDVWWSKVREILNR